ncbi:MAG: hypothetical protein J0L92_32660 [Deltaproteobacteria bacterium]|nr:hypothetical protein [Deltaproteobacteria bacterium]
MKAVRSLAALLTSCSVGMVAACAEPTTSVIDASIIDATRVAVADAHVSLDAYAPPDAPSDAGPPPADWLVAQGTATCASREGRVWCWGTSWTEMAVRPVEIVELRGARTIALGRGHACAILGDGRVACAGSNRTGQLGVSPADLARRETFELVEAAPPTVAIAVSQTGLTSCAIDVEGAVWCWGDDALGQTGSPIPPHATGANAPQPTPQRIEGLAGARSLSLGQYHSCALLDDGRAQCWGYDWWGALGRGEGYTGMPQHVPADLAGIEDALSITVDGNGGCVLGASGEVACWGGHVHLYPGWDPDTDDDCPVVVTQARWRAPRALALPVSSALLLGGGAGCIDHEGWSCFGDTRGDLVAIDDVGDDATLALGMGHVCALDAGGAIRCRGRGDEGQLGDGMRTSSHAWVDVTLE